MWLAFAITGGLLILFVLLLILLYIIYKITFLSPYPGQNDIHHIPEGEQYHPYRDRMIAQIDALNARPFEQVYITSRDGLRLAARYYHTRDGAPLDIAVHGYRGTALRDMCGGTPFGIGEGHNVLLVDQRAHGKSGGRSIAFGVTERYDCIDWIQYALGRFGEDTPILLYGVSMGAATVLMAAGLPELPRAVKGVVADCPYSSPKAIIGKVCHDMKIPFTLAWPFIVAAAWLYGGFYLPATDVTTAIRQAHVPILLLHGEEDRFVPCEMSRALADVCRAPVTLETFPHAPHGICYFTDTKRYEQVVRRFLATLPLTKQ